MQGILLSPRRQAPSDLHTFTFLLMVLEIQQQQAQLPKVQLCEYHQKRGFSLRLSEFPFTIQKRGTEMRTNDSVHEPFSRREDVEPR